MAEQGEISKNAANLLKLKKGVRNFAMGALMLGSQTADKNIANQPNQTINTSGLYPIVDTRHIQAQGAIKLQKGQGNVVNIAVGSENVSATKEVLKPFSSQVVMVDFAPSKPSDGINQKEFPTEASFMQSLLKDKYLSEDQLKREFGDNFSDKLPEVFNKYPEVALVYGAYGSYLQTKDKTHGQLVEGTMESIWNFGGHESSVEMTPIQNAFDAEKTQFISDALGNKGISTTVDQKEIIDALKSYPSQRIVNISFQVGDIQAYYMEKDYAKNVNTHGLWDSSKEDFFPGADITEIDSNGNTIGLANGKKVNPYTKQEYEELVKLKSDNPDTVVELKNPHFSVNGAYAKEKATQNLAKLYEIANAFPDKLIMAAAGNFGDDLRDASQKLQKPNNLITFAQWGYQDEAEPVVGPVNKVYGADMYVDNSNIGTGDGSSFSTGTATAIESLLLSKGFTPDEAKKKLLDSSERSAFAVDGSESKANVIYSDVTGKIDIDNSIKLDSEGQPIPAKVTTIITPQT